MVLRRGGTSPRGSAGPPCAPALVRADVRLGGLEALYSLGLLGLTLWGAVLILVLGWLFQWF